MNTNFFFYRGGIGQLVKEIGNVCTEVAKDFIGALAGIGKNLFFFLFFCKILTSIFFVGKALADPIGKGIGSAFKNVGIAVAIAGGIALLVVGIYFGVKKSKENLKKSK